jgi:hypothetical protein
VRVNHGWVAVLLTSLGMTALCIFPDLCRANKFGSVYLDSGTGVQWGVREWFRTVSPSLGGGAGDAGLNYSVAHVYLPTIANGRDCPYVENGYLKGLGGDGVAHTSPTWFIVRNETGQPADSVEIDYDVHPSVGSLHQYTVKRTGTHSGNYEWTFSYDGDSGYSFAWDLAAPANGYPLVGGEVYQGDPDNAPNMNAQGRNNGTGVLNDYLCFKNTSNSWVEWDTSYSGHTHVAHGGGITVTQSSPYYSYFDATGN